jgi:hypothetical protein
MVKAKRIIVDVRTREVKEEEFDYKEPEPVSSPEPINLDDVRKLLNYAKKMGWI